MHAMNMLKDSSVIYHHSKNLYRMISIHGTGMQTMQALSLLTLQLPARHCIVMVLRTLRAFWTNGISCMDGIVRVRLKATVQ